MPSPWYTRVPPPRLGRRLPLRTWPRRLHTATCAPFLASSPPLHLRLPCGNSAQSSSATSRIGLPAGRRAPGGPRPPRPPPTTAAPTPAVGVGAGRVLARLPFCGSAPCHAVQTHSALVPCVRSRPCTPSAPIPRPARARPFSLFVPRSRPVGEGAPQRSLDSVVSWHVADCVALNKQRVLCRRTIALLTVKFTHLCKAYTSLVSDVSWS